MIIRNKHDDALVVSLRSKLDKDLLALEKYTHVMDNILIFWDSEDFHTYMKSLIVTDRAEQREGFPFEVHNELREVDKIHREMFPKHIPEINLHKFTFA